MNLIQERMKLLNRVDFSVVQHIEAMVAREDLVIWGQGPAGELRPDTTGNPSKRLSEACWEMIQGCMP